jgi:hypothetical protein
VLGIAASIRAPGISIHSGTEGPREDNSLIGPCSNIGGADFGNTGINPGHVYGCCQEDKVNQECKAHCTSTRQFLFKCEITGQKIRPPGRQNRESHLIVKGYQNDTRSACGRVTHFRTKEA